MSRTRWVAAAGAAGAAVGAGLWWATRRADGSGPVDAADRVQRTARLATAGARAGTGYVAMRARAVVADPERREELEAEYQLRTAEQVAAMLGGMKGAVMKLSLIHI